MKKLPGGLKFEWDGKPDACPAPPFAANFSLIEASLWQAGTTPPEDLDWLQWSWREPADFWGALHADWEIRHACQSRSVLFTRYAIYHDLVGRQPDNAAPALVWFDGVAWQEKSYASLAALADGLAVGWEAAGVSVGDCVAILHSGVAEWLPCCLAAFRLGLSVALLPPKGMAFVTLRLANLQPQWLAVNPLYQRKLGEDWQAKVLPTNPANLPPARPAHGFAATDTAVWCFDPTSPAPAVPTAVNAETLYLGVLRDGLLGLGLQIGQVCAAPGWHLLESQPALILSTLMAGGCWVQLGLADVRANPDRLLEKKVDVLGVSRPLRDSLVRQPPAGDKTWRHWFRQPAESSDLPAWLEFASLLGLEKAHASNLAWNAAAGGAVVFSARCKGSPHVGALPAAGCQWQLGRVDKPTLPAPTGMGRLALGKAVDGELHWQPTPHLLTAYRRAWQYVGHYPLSRAGRTFPAQEVMALLNPLWPWLALVESPAEGDEQDRLQVLLVFGTNDAAALQGAIATELGGDFLPDRIECLPLLPKRGKQGGADAEWCQLHYLTGELYRRQRDEMYQNLSALKQMILAETTQITTRKP